MKPYPVAVKLEPIYKLIANAQRRQAVKELWEKKMGYSTDSLDTAIDTGLPSRCVINRQEQILTFTNNDPDERKFGNCQCGVTVNRSYRL